MKLTLRLYFHKIKIEGAENVPKDVPLVVTVNHQNAFLDALLAGAFISIPLHFLARQDVFTSWSKPLLKLLNMIPIYRIRDGYKNLSLNDATFEQCRELFGTNKSILIFAEGNHAKYHYLRPLTKGAARLALQSHRVSNNLMVLPVGLNYFDHQAANSTVLIQFGKAIPVQDYIKDYEANKAKGLIAIRDAISAGMKETLIIPELTSDYESRVSAIFQEKNEELSFDELRLMDISNEVSEPPKVRKHFFAWILNPVPMFIIKKIVGRIDDVVFHSSIKFGAGLFLFPIWWAVVFLLMWLTVGINIAFLTVIVMIFGLYYSYLR